MSSFVKSSEDANQPRYWHVLCIFPLLPSNTMPNIDTKQTCNKIMIASQPGWCCLQAAASICKTFTHSSSHICHTIEHITCNTFLLWHCWKFSQQSTFISRLDSSGVYIFAPPPTRPLLRMLMLPQW